MSEAPNPPPGWRLLEREISNGCWHVECVHYDGRSVSREGGDLDALQRECVADALRLPEKRFG